MNLFSKPNSQPLPSGSRYDARDSQVSLLTFFQPITNPEITQRIASFYAVNPITNFPDNVSEPDGKSFFSMEKEALIEYVSMM